jgi:hypothetical protein
MSPRRRGRGRGRGGAVGLAGSGATPGAEGSSLEAGPPAAGSETAVAGGAAAAPGAAAPRAARQFQGGPGSVGRGNAGRARVEPSGARRPPGPAVPPPVRLLVEAHVDGEEPAAQKASCTLAQMRRFIKSRPYVPVHELRRRFEIEGIEDEVSAMATGQGTLYVGLPELQAGYLGELVKAGEVGCEMLLDPTGPAVVGVFPMRPVARQ